LRLTRSDAPDERDAVARKIIGRHSNETVEPSRDLVEWIDEFVSWGSTVPKFNWIRFRLRVERRGDDWRSLVVYKYSD
jgi:hypothetical protein